MRKLLIALIVFSLALAAVGALAAGVNNTRHDFGDFSLMFPDDEVLQMDEKTSGEVYFSILSPSTSASDFTNNLNCVWGPEKFDLSGVNPQLLLDSQMAGIEGQFEAYGIALTNLNGIRAERIGLGGRDAVILAYSYDVDYTGMGIDLKASLICMSVMVSDPAFGNYTFTITSTNQAGLEEFSTVLDSLIWNVE